jgi:hypothetical protein
MPTTAKCHRTGDAIPLIDGFITGNPRTGEWVFVQEAAPEELGDYNIAMKQLLRGPEELCDWMAQLRDKTWFSPEKFFDFFTRFRI